MNTFRLQLRFLVPLVLTLAAAAYLALPLVERLTLGRFERDLDLRGARVTSTLADSIAEALTDPKDTRLQALSTTRRRTSGCWRPACAGRTVGCDIRPPAFRPR